MKTDPDAALRPPLVNTSPGPEYGDDTRLFQGIPGIERAENGRLWAVWYGGGTGETGENYVMVVTSEDDGEAWSSLCLVIDPPYPVRAFDPVLWHDPTGRLWLFWAQSYEHFDGRAGIWAINTQDSQSARPTWSLPRRICNGVMMNKPTVLSGGEWLLPVAVWRRSERPDIPPRERRPNVFASSDGGESWELKGGPKVPEGSFSEQMVVEREDSSLWMLVRTDYGIGESTSEDKGITWTELRPSPIKHTTSRFFIRRLISGNLLLVKHGPIDQVTGRSHLTCYLSGDDGRSWSDGLTMDEREGVSYPDGVQSPDGTIYLVYDYMRHGDKQILMATLTEDDILQGRPLSHRARFRVLINQGTGRE